MRNECLEVVYELAKKDSRVFFVGSDLAAGTLQKFKDEIPDRFIMEGVSEANMVGLSSGLGMEGKVVYTNTIASFLTRRGYEQIVLDGCLHKSNIRLLANGGGVVYATLGPSHLALDDLAILRVIPNLTILAPADAQEMRHLMEQTLDYEGPIYVRFARNGSPVVTEKDKLKEIGKASVYGSSANVDVSMVTTGITLQLAKKAAGMLSEFGLSSSIVHFPTVKPFDADTLVAQIRKSRSVVSIEEHFITGGLGSAVAEVLSETPGISGKAFKRIGFPDTFPKGYGFQDEMMERNHLTPKAVVESVKRFFQ